MQLVKTSVLAEASYPETKTFARLYDILLVIGASFAIAISAQVFIPLGFTPVPVTAQTLTVLLAGALLGRKRATLSVLAYIGLGTVGVPLFAGGGVGFARLLGPTGGYLAGFVAAAYITGWLAEHGWGRKPLTVVAMMLAGNAIIYLFGLPRLAGFVGWDKVLGLGFYPFVIGDIVKLIAASLILPLGYRLIRQKLE